MKVYTILIRRETPLFNPAITCQIKTLSILNTLYPQELQYKLNTL